MAQEAAVAAAKQETEDLASTADAIDTTFDLPYPAALMPAADSLALDQLVEHERLRDGGLLRYRDTMDGLRDANGTQSLYIFMSHQWTAWSAPDPSGTQLRVMKAAVRHVAAVHGWSLDAVMVWVDYCSIPQSNAACMQQAISSLSAYSACAAAFVIVAPEVEHSDTKALCGVDTYRKRMWCRAEQLFHSPINGTGSMWLATAEASVTPLSDLPSWSTYSGYLNVFDGDATDETDKLMLVLPVLGLMQPRGCRTSARSGAMEAARATCRYQSSRRYWTPSPPTRRVSSRAKSSCVTRRRVERCAPARRPRVE